MKHAAIFTRLAQRADPNIPILDAAMDEIAALETLCGELKLELLAANAALQESGDRATTIAALEAENKKVKTDLSNCDGELMHYKVDITQQAEKLAAAADALERLARLGSEPLYGNSTGNEIAQKALAAIAEGKP